MKKPKSLLDEVCQTLPQKGTQRFHALLPADLASELEAIRERFWQGQLVGSHGKPATKTGLSTSLAKVLQRRGVMIGHKGVLAWLEEKR